MIKWEEERTINSNIETIWEFFKEENMYKIMPNVVENEPVETKEGEVGSIYRQSYKEGKRVETYLVETLEYTNTPNNKHKRIAFELGKAFKIDLSFTLHKIDEGHTRFVYSGQNEGINFIGRVLVKLGGEKNNKKVVDDFMNRVEQAAV
ncbi:SRPBCC family protein [Pontibacillus halophilus]|uniref:SRPBCC family protein n=1 Tax=Pontibacillus halophilus TaxID=516704 RepID=UPI0004187964|nr:SRPBCC family protein [Pontibacillus halophilus]